MRQWIDLMEEDLPFTFELDEGDPFRGRRSVRIHAYCGTEYAGSLSLAAARYRDDAYSAEDLFVNAPFRRKGLATAMYNFAHKNGIAPIIPDTKQSTMGSKFWDAHLRSKWKLGSPPPEQVWTPTDQ